MTLNELQQITFRKKSHGREDFYGAMRTGGRAKPTYVKEHVRPPFED